MNSILKVTPEKLIESAEQFAGTEQTVRSILEEMKGIIDGFKTIWQGEAATGFANRFSALSDDMEKMCGMIREHSADLNQMANEYKAAEDESMQEAAALGTEAIS